MTTKDTRERAVPVLAALSSGEPVESIDLAGLIQEATSGGPVGAFQLTLVILDAAAELVRNMYPGKAGSYDLTGYVPDASGAVDPTDPVDSFVFHMIEHQINGEHADVFDHMLEVGENPKIYVRFLANLCAVFHTISQADRTNMTAAMVIDKRAPVVEFGGE